MFVKYIKYAVFFILTLLIIAIITLPCFAIDTGFSVDEIPEEDISVIFAKLKLETVKQPTINSGFSCFDVNHSGSFALGFGHGQRDYVFVYDQNGVYLYGFSFDNNGSLGLGWNGEILILYLLRSDLAVEVDLNGTCVAITRIQDSMHNSQYLHNTVFSNKRNINGATYLAEHWLFNNELLHWGSYSRLVRNMPNGDSVTLFDQTKNQITKSLILLIGITLLFSISITTIVHKAKPKIAKGTCCVNSNEK